MPGCIVSATTASFSSLEKRRLRATPMITSIFENVSDAGTCLGLFLGPPASAGVRSKQGAVHGVNRSDNRSIPVGTTSPVLPSRLAVRNSAPSAIPKGAEVANQSANHR